MSQFQRVGAACAALMVPCAASAGDLPDAVPSVIVVGQRASLDTASQIRRAGPGVVDAVVADQIDKLPDFSVTDALQRIPGVQIARDRGDGTAVAIRGLTQMETTLNGREVFTAGAGRNLDFADVPADMVAAIAIHKTAIASQLEGGVGGLADLRTRRPFDFSGTRLAATARYVHGELAGGGAPQYSALASTRWQTAVGEFGALASVSVQRRAWREDQKSSAEPRLRKDLLAGQDVLVQAGGTETASVGRRERNAFSTMLQWRPSAGIELYAEGSYAQFKTVQDSYQVNLSAPATFVPGSVTLFPGTRDVQTVTWTNAPVSVLSFARDTVDRNRQLAAGGSWRTGNWLLQLDASHTESYNNLFFSGATLAATAPAYRIDYSGKVPVTAVEGLAQQGAAAYRYVGVPYRTRPFDGALDALRLDATLARPGSLFHTVTAGVRLARRSAGNAPGLIVADAPVSLPASAAPLGA
ncbi:TonB-dependent receptor plug domain-containing protein, partial [Duganella sp. FT92W]